MPEAVAHLLDQPLGVMTCAPKATRLATASLMRLALRMTVSSAAVTAVRSLGGNAAISGSVRPVVVVAGGNMERRCRTRSTLSGSVSVGAEGYRPEHAESNGAGRGFGVYCSWSGGKDCAFALPEAGEHGAEPRLLLTMMTEGAERSRSHGLHRSLLQHQGGDRRSDPVWQRNLGRYADVFRESRRWRWHRE